MRLSDLDISRTRLNELVADYVWNARNKDIFIKKLEGSTYEELAEEYNLSTQRTKEIVKDCINRIAKHI